MNRLSILLLLSGIVSTPSFAGPYAEAVNTCFANATTGKDRTDLARWIFVAMAQHPEMAEDATVSPKRREDINATVGALYSRLMGVACTKEVKEAIRQEGDATAKGGFEFLGKLAMQELMNNPRVVESFKATEKHMDIKRVNAVLRD